MENPEDGEGTKAETADGGSESGVANQAEAIEALQDPDRFPPPKSVVNDKGEYLWGESNLPNRVMNRASRTALSVHFDVPPKEFIFLFRKLLGAYTFLHVIKAQVRGNTILEPFIHMREDEDRERVAQKINGQAADS